MPTPAPACRWRTAVQAAARRVLASRWRHTLESLELTRAALAHLRATSVPTDPAARRAARRIQQLEHLRAALACELHANHS